jgi:asparagine synthase (glutamine-hydrolysing)
MERDGYWITYNGEIYNYVEIRSELEALGRRFFTESDTEVLLAAYIQWGEACLPRLNGMWGFAVWDPARRKLFCARDHAGIKPFYYAQGPNGRFSFASETRAVLAGGAAGRPDPAAVFDFLCFSITPSGDRTFYSDVRQLPAGCRLEVDAEGEVSVARWWRPTPRRPSGPPAAALRELLEDSVRLRLRSDVTVGSCLSGGLDSSGIVCIASKAGPMEVFTAAYEDKRLDEREFAAQIARQGGAKHRLVFPTAEGLRTDLDDLLRVQGEPPHGPSIYAQYCVMRKIREAGLKVVLDGQGSDELFLGYEWSYAFLLRSLAAERRFLEIPRQFFSAARHGLTRRLTALQIAGLSLYTAFPSLRWRRNLSRAGRYLGDGLRDIRSSAGFDAAFSASSIADARMAEIEVNPLPALLRYEDRNSMAFSVETRLPFLDYRIMELALSLTPSELVQDGWTKKPVRDALRGIVPDSVLWRRDKMGFSVPVADWMRSLSPVFLDAFSGDGPGGGLLDGQTLRADMERGRLPADLAWRALTVKMWLKQSEAQRRPANSSDMFSGAG